MTDKSLDLEISRLLNVPRAAIWKAWSNPDILKLWWCPKPWVTEVRGFDFRAGGVFDTLMRGPDGEQSPNPGVFLDIVAGERVVFTTALTEGLRPAHEPFIPITAIFTLADEGKGTRYIARALHPDLATAERHAEMGFYEGWGICIDQLEEVAKTLK